MSGAEKQKAVHGLVIASKNTACRTSPVLKPDAEAEREQFTDIEKSSYSQVDAVGYTDPNAVQHLIVKCVVYSLA